MFSFQNMDAGELELGGGELEPLRWRGEVAKFDLSLTVREEGERFGGFVTYRTELFEGETVGRMLEHFARLAAGLAVSPERPAALLPLLDAAERTRVLEGWNSTARPYPRDRCIHHLFEEQVERTPDAVALVFEGEGLTYAELDAHAGRIARLLRGRGVGPETRVGVCLERSPEGVAALLGVLKAGGVYVPLDPTHPAGRPAYVLEDAAVTVLLTQERLRERLPEDAAGVVCLDDPHPLDSGDGPVPEGCATPEHLAYVIYTSGSTGRPKGVLTSHGGVVNYLTFLRDEYGVGPGDTVLQLAATSFDASLRDTLGPLTVGARLVLARAEELAEPGRLLGHLREHGVTAVMALVPSLLRPLLAAAEEEGGAAGTLRLLLMSGEPLPVADVRRAHRVFGPGVRVVNQWGATECTLSSTLHTVTGDEDAAIAPVGAPIHNTRVYVLDAEGEPVPAGVPGEAYIATPGLARGYGGQPELTAERFVPDPFSGRPGARMYRVGDRVRWRRRGGLEFLGRTDGQVKVQGVRVEPGEVEAVLREHPGVRAAAVVAREAAPGEARLVGYVVPEEGAELPPAALRAFLAERLPPYLVPTAWVWLGTLPLLPNGKLDRRALPEPEGAPPGVEYTAPRTPTEEILAGIWAEVLKRGRVGAHDDFFALGGHSLLAARMIARVRQAFGTELPLRTVFEAPTVAGVAGRIDGALREGVGSDAPPLVPVPREGPLPLSFAQQRLWFLDRPSLPLRQDGPQRLVPGGGGAQA
ncbi:MAG TPA: amino acid adenylation domain-containing protein, partial [Longimicrobiaceae bacterium]|nr:amino acid adenylation domain-containing protein [Longimicrobiaceae bacterium]